MLLLLTISENLTFVKNHIPKEHIPKEINNLMEFSKSKPSNLGSGSQKIIIFNPYYHKILVSLPANLVFVNTLQVVPRYQKLKFN